MSFVRRLAAAGIALALTACRTAVDYGVPGAKTITLRNVYLEYVLIADEYVSLKKYDKAEEYYKAALGSKETYWTAYYKLARVYALDKKWDLAEEAYSRLLERDEENTDLLRSMAYIKGMSGNLNEAMDIYNRLLDKRGDDETTIANAAAIMIAQGQLDTAGIYVDMLKEKFPESAALAALGKAMEDARKADAGERESWEEYEKSLKDSP